jgi:hypothetical protein
VLLLRVWK